MLAPLLARPADNRVIDDIGVSQFLERLSMIEYQLGQIADHFGIAEHGPDLPDHVDPPAPEQ